jgi:predicted phage terminase large subunit-like protein
VNTATYEPRPASTRELPHSDQFLSLWDYFSQVFVPLNNLELPLKDLHRGTCEVLEKALLGDLHKSFVIVNIPPRVGKTKMMEAAISWQLAYFPDAQFIYTSYSNDLAKTSVRYIQEVMSAPWYQELFETKLGQIRQADHFTTAQGGKVYGDGVGGSLTGLGAGLKRKAGGAIFIDDPAKPDEALSRVESEKIRFWFENTLKSRRNSSSWTPIILCMQRLDVDDLSGFLLREYPDDVHHIKFPAMVNGESTIPETVSTKSLKDTQRVNPFAFAAQYLQEPIIVGGNLIKLSDFKYFDPESAPKAEIKILVADTATKAKTANDYSVVQVWARSKHCAYLLDQIRGKWEPAQLLKNTRALYEKHNRAASPVSYIAIEEAGAGFAIIQEMRKRGIPAKGIVPLKDKVSRVEEILAFQQTGMVYLPKGAPWLPAFELELAQFRRDGKSAQDDQVDCLAYSIKLLLGKGTSILNVLGKKR